MKIIGNYIAFCLFDVVLVLLDQKGPQVSTVTVSVYTIND